MNLAMEGLPSDISDDEWENVSVSSTIRSDPDPDQDYEIEAILADIEREDGEVRYLVKWSGYPLHRATWEPLESFGDDHAGLGQFKRQRQKEYNGLVEPFSERNKRRWEKADNDERRHAIRIALRANFNDPRRARERYAALQESRNSNSNSVLRADRDSPMELIESADGHQAKTLLSDSKESDVTEMTEVAEYNSSLASNGPFSATPTPQPVLKTLSGFKITKRKWSDTSALSKKASELTAKKASVKTGAALFENWQHPRKASLTRQPTFQAASKYNAKRFQTISQLVRFRKYAAGERAPNLDDLEFIADSQHSSRSTTRGVGQDVSAERDPQHDGYSPIHEPSNPGQYKQMQTRTDPHELSHPVNANMEPEIDHLEKVPLTCYHWYHEKCKDSASECRFLHSSEGADGISGKDGYVPPKYWRQPLTCPFWWTSRKGCRNSDQDCRFAHRNTGLVAAIGRGEPERVDPEQLPVFQRLRLTCHSWWYSPTGCSRPDEECAFAHYNTGLVAGTSKQAAPESVDPLQFPVSQRLSLPASSSCQESAPGSEKSSDALKRSKVTCRFWRKGYCKRFDQCKFAHEDASVHADSPKSVGSPQIPAIGPATPRDESLYPTEFLAPQVEAPREPETTALVEIAIETTNPDVHISDNTKSMNATLFIKQQPSIVAHVQLNIRNHQLQLMKEVFGEEPQWRLEHVCHVDYFEEFWVKRGERVASGTITPVEETLPTIRALNSVSNFLMSNLCGAIVTHSLALVVLFPAHSDAWNFLQQNNTKAEISLGFYAMRMVPSSFSGVGSRLVFPANDPSPAPVVNGFNSLLDIKAEELFPNGSPKMVFLLYPEIKHPEYELVVRIFQRIGVVIHNAQTPGAWTYFKERLHVTHGVVIVHPNFYAFHKIPDLAACLVKNGITDFFRLGWGLSYGELDEQTVPRSPIFHRIFPQGAAILITDIVWEEYYKEVFKLLQGFHWLHKQQIDSGVPTWKFGGRPGLIEYTYNLAADKKDKESPHSTETRLRISRLLESFLPETAKDFNPPDDVALLSEDPDVLPKYQQLLDEGDEDAATNYLVEWFAGWAIEHVENYRRFTVVHYGKKSHWSKKFQHISFSTPHDIIKAINEKKQKV